MLWGCCMNIQDLIQEGRNIREQCCSTSGNAMQTISGERYTTWLYNCSQYLVSNFPKNPLTEDFLKNARKANGNYINTFDVLYGILVSFEGVKVIEHTNLDYILESVFTHYNRMAKSIQNRHASRTTIEINDEYDVQDLLLGILRLFVDDVRPEDSTPSYAGGNSRIDFFLPDYSTYIETKMTRDGLADRKIGEELLIDIGRYKNSCDKLICFVYDAGGFLKNPYGLIKDLENLSTDELEVKVYINPI